MQFPNLPDAARLAINHMVAITEKEKKLLKKALDLVYESVADDITANTAAIAAIPEEGTYNPTLTCSTSGDYTFGGGQTTLAFARIGSLVHVQGFLQVTGASSPSGQLKLSLPPLYPGASLDESADIFYTPCVIYNHGGTIENPHLGISGNTYANFYKITDAGNPTILDNTHVDTAFFISVNFSYRCRFL